MPTGEGDKKPGCGGRSPGFSQHGGLIPVTIREAFLVTGAESTRDRIGCS
jgi:hypothetical protein